jgi:hypothetical protein
MRCSTVLAKCVRQMMSLRAAGQRSQTEGQRGQTFCSRVCSTRLSESEEGDDHHGSRMRFHATSSLRHQRDRAESGKMTPPLRELLTAYHVDIATSKLVKASR